jgi:hypothetical protein
MIIQRPEVDKIQRNGGEKAVQLSTTIDLRTASEDEDES